MYSNNTHYYLCLIHLNRWDYMLYNLRYTLKISSSLIFAAIKCTNIQIKSTVDLFPYLKTEKVSTFCCYHEECLNKYPCTYCIHTEEFLRKDTKKWNCWIKG